jgi:putative PIN family toxin of toxin-antitoxin system
MIRAVIDTNIFVSGFLGKGPPHKILEAWSQAKFKLIVSDEIVMEYESVLNRLLDHSPFLVNRTIESVSLHAEYVQPANLSSKLCRDPNDEIFIRTAIAGRVNYIVSGDKDLLVLKTIMNIEVLSPRAFLQIIESKS